MRSSSNIQIVVETTTSMRVQRRAGLVLRCGQPSRARRHVGHGRHCAHTWMRTLWLISNTGTAFRRRMVATDGFVYETFDHKYSEMAKPLSDELTQATSQVLQSSCLIVFWHLGANQRISLRPAFRWSIAAMMQCQPRTGQGLPTAPGSCSGPSCRQRPHKREKRVPSMREACCAARKGTETQ